MSYFYSRPTNRPPIESHEAFFLPVFSHNVVRRWFVLDSQVVVDGVIIDSRAWRKHPTVA
jgi:hypothetical protein